MNTAQGDRVIQPAQNANHAPEEYVLMMIATAANVEHAQTPNVCKTAAIAPIVKFAAMA